MCVIIVKNRGVRPPNCHILRRCWETNPDGAGFMWQTKNGMIHGRKGFMTWRSFLSAWNEYGFAKDDCTNDSIVLHFRIATSGGVRPENCHPFPVVKKNNRLRQLEFSARLAIAHNGVFGSGRGALSDTMIWVKDVLTGFATIQLNSQEICNEIEDTLAERNRVVIMGRNIAQPLLLGMGWTQANNGLWFSNTRWSRLQYSA